MLAGESIAAYGPARCEAAQAGAFALVPDPKMLRFSQIGAAPRPPAALAPGAAGAQGTALTAAGT